MASKGVIADFKSYLSQIIRIKIDPADTIFSKIVTHVVVMQKTLGKIEF